MHCSVRTLTPAPLPSAGLPHEANVASMGAGKLLSCGSLMELSRTFRTVSKWLSIWVLFMRQTLPPILLEPVLHMNETDHKRAGVRRWSWVMRNEDLAAYRVGQRRTKAVAKQLQGKGFSGFTVSDNYSAYRHIPSKRKQLCWPHILRSLKGLKQRLKALGKLADTVVSDVQRLFALHKGLSGASHNLAKFQAQVFPVQNSISQKILGEFIQHEELRPLGRLYQSQ